MALALSASFAVDALAEGKDSKKSVKKETGQSSDAKRVSKELKNGRSLFSNSCASCHPAGGNVVSRSKPITSSWTLASLATFKSYLEQPIGTMPHYDHIIKDDKNLELLYKYVKTLKTRAPVKKNN
jgi:hypothetical protein